MGHGIPFGGRRRSQRDDVGRARTKKTSNRLIPLAVRFRHRAASVVLSPTWHGVTPAGCHFTKGAGPVKCLERSAHWRTDWVARFLWASVQ